MKTLLTTSALALGVFGGSVVAQEMPKPGAEQARIAFFAGTWKYEGITNPSPMGPGGKVAFTETCRWFEGGFHLVCQSEGTNPLGPVKMQGVTGYDPAQQTYTYYGFTSRGEGFFVRGNVSGKTWTWSDETVMNGTPMKFRVTSVEESPTSYTFKMEVAVAGGDWTVMEEGKATKQ